MSRELAGEVRLGRTKYSTFKLLMRSEYRKLLFLNMIPVQENNILIVTKTKLFKTQFLNL